MSITVETAAARLRDHDNIAILAHQKPDGDTLGSCFALLYALELLGKTARVECADGYPGRYRILYGDYAPADFQPAFVVACDVASGHMLGALEEKYPRIDLCIDHHKSNTHYAAETLLDPAAAATTELLFPVIRAMGVQPDKRVATALYTGLATDTGCFRFSNVTPATHRLAADLLDWGADQHAVNKQMFDNKTPGRIQVERLMMDSLDYSHGGRCLIVSLPADIHERFGVAEDDLDGISAFPRRIAGVLCGITVRARGDGTFRVSMRTEPPIDASRICTKFGGGGHTAAAGCTMQGELAEVQERLRMAVGEELEALGLWS